MMKNLIRQRLHELSVPDNVFRVPKRVSITPEEKVAIQNVRSEHLDIEDLGGNGNIAHLKIVFPFETQATGAIVVDIEVLQGAIYQIHIHMPEELQGLGLAYKIYKAVIMDFGHLYSGNGRVLSSTIKYIWQKLETTAGIECIKNASIGQLCMAQNNPDKEQLVQFMN